MKENGYEYVDLGLPSKTMWATCNVGSSTPEDEGLLFQFGRVDGYRFGHINNKFRLNKQNKQDTGSEYIPVTTSGKIYKKHEILDLEDDAAHVNMGGKWRMPTKDELKELVDNTTHRVEAIHGVQGMMFTSNINGNQLFIPFIQGWWCNGNWDNWFNYFAYIWSSQVHASNDGVAYRLLCNSSTYSNINGTATRVFAFSARGVFKSNATSNEHKNNINMLI